MRRNEPIQRKKNLALTLMLMVVVVMVASLAAPPSDATTGGSEVVRVSGRIRPSVKAALVGTGENGSILVKANTPWIVVVDETVTGGARIRRVFQGGKTGDKGRLIPLAGRVENFSATREP